MSTVLYRNQSIDEVLRNTTDIIVVKDLGKGEPFYSVIFPASTNYFNKGETKYEEHVALFEVVEIIKSNAFKKGQQIKVWTAKAYDESAVRFQHENGAIKSPMHLNYKPKEDPGAGQMIIFLRHYRGPAKKAEDVWENVFGAKEGVGFKHELLKLISDPKVQWPTEEPDERRLPPPRTPLPVKKGGE